MIIPSQCLLAAHTTPTSNRSVARTPGSMSQCLLAAHTTPTLDAQAGLIEAHAVAVPLGSTYHSYKLDPQRSSTRLKSQCLLAAHTTPTVVSIPQLRLSMSQCLLAAHTTPTVLQQNYIDTLTTIVAVPLGSTYHSYIKKGNIAEAFSMSQCLLAAHTTPTLELQ